MMLIDERRSGSSLVGDMAKAKVERGNERNSKKINKEIKSRFYKTVTVLQNRQLLRTAQCHQEAAQRQRHSH